ncbi:uncharacterized protein LOC120345012 [Styela clava]
MNRRVSTSIASSEKEWFQIRHCFVQAYFKYPLYKYLIPNEVKRKEFLTNYIEANYDVAVRHGNSLLLCIRMVNEEDDSCQLKKSFADDKKIIGGALFVPPTTDGGDWDCADDDTFFKSYENYGLNDIDNDAYHNIISHEKWETENIMTKICKLKFEAWMAFFWAIDPEFAGKGYGSASYPDCMQILQNYQEKQLPSVRNLMTPRRRCQMNMPLSGIENYGKTSQMISTVSTTHSFPLPLPDFVQAGDKTICQWSRTYKDPVVFFPSHCERAVKFHMKNGFHLIGKTQVNNRKFPCDASAKTYPPWANLLVIGLYEKSTYDQYTSGYHCKQKKFTTRFRDRMGYIQDETFPAP